MWNEELVTEWINPCGTPNLATFKTLISLQRIVLSQRLYMLSEQSPADTLFKLLEQNLDTCPRLNSVTVAQCPSSWPRFLSQLRKWNREAILRKKMKCIEELGFYQPLHATIIKWLVDAINAKVLNVIERPPVREGNAWPMRPCEAWRNEISQAQEAPVWAPQVTSQAHRKPKDRKKSQLGHRIASRPARTQKSQVGHRIASRPGRAQKSQLGNVP